ncbi:unnamed protein product, partial [Adineta steineri]
MKNESSNNPVFTLERYKQTIELINDAKLKRSEDTSIEYYAPINELYDIIRIAHSNIGHRGIKNTLKEIKKKCVNVTEKQVKLFISECNECKIKRAKPRNSSKLVIRSIISNDFNSRGQVDLIDMQSSPDGEF